MRSRPMPPLANALSLLALLALSLPGQGFEGRDRRIFSFLRETPGVEPGFGGAAPRAGTAAPSLPAQAPRSRNPASRLAAFLAGLTYSAPFGAAVGITIR